MTDNVMTPEFRVSYPYLFTPQQPMQGAASKDPKYSVVMLFPKGADLTVLKKVADAALIEKFGEKLRNPEFTKTLRSPFRNQKDKAKFDEATGKTVMPDGYVEGAIFLTATSKQKPGVVDANVQPILDTGQVYAGCYARATVRAYAYENSGNRGVAFGLQNFQKLRDGDSLSGRLKPEDEFAPVDAADNGGEAGASAMSVFS